MFNGNKTFTTFSNINGFNQLNEKKRSKSKNKKRNFESIYNCNNIYNNNYNDNQIQFDFILNHFEKKDDWLNKKNIKKKLNILYKFYFFKYKNKIIKKYFKTNLNIPKKKKKKKLNI